MDEQTQQDLFEFYWQTDVSVAAIADHFGVRVHEVPALAGPAPAKAACPNCGEPMVWTSRTGRNEDRSTCASCEHTGRSMYTCPCEHCAAARQAMVDQREAEQRRLEQIEHQRWIDECVNEDYVKWAVSQLNRRQTLFFRASLVQLRSEDGVSWDEVAQEAGVVSPGPYIDKLRMLRLLYADSRLAQLNAAIPPERIEVQTEVRKIRASTRFDVFQRDGHACQYCGRQAPDVELVIDHLTPVAEGGTDDVDNLITACAKCNSGKAAKLIEDFTGGHSRDDWRSILRARRTDDLRRRRDEIADIVEHWAAARRVGGISIYDERGIQSLAERYEAEWICAAIDIAVTKRPCNYVKYVGGILRQWAKDGPPETLDPTRRQRRHESTPATTAQLAYVRGLLERENLALEDFYPVSVLEDLTMADAGRIIDALIVTTLV